MIGVTNTVRGELVEPFASDGSFDRLTGRTDCCTVRGEFVEPLVLRQTLDEQMIKTALPNAKS